MKFTSLYNHTCTECTHLIVFRNACSTEYECMHECMCEILEKLMRAVERAQIAREPAGSMSFIDLPRRGTSRRDTRVCSYIIAYGARY